jgi:hypothetical protein
MIQRFETSWEEKYEMYNVLEKDSLIKMLIEANRMLQNMTPKIQLDNCNYYCSGTDTSMRCIHCGKLKWEQSGK